MSWRDRILSDGSDRDLWKIARHGVIGASDAKTLAKPESVHLYVAQKLKREVFSGNVFTDNGYRWEPMFLGWAGFEHNVALVHAPDELGFAATPDGFREAPSGMWLAECKVKHVDPTKRTKGPTLPEKRQIAWQFRVFPEAEHLAWIWGDIDKSMGSDDLFDDEPRAIVFHRDDPELVALTHQIEPIAREVLIRVRAALEAEKELDL